MAVKYLRNTDDATIVCRIPSDKNKSFVFRARKLDKRNNIVISNGYSDISEEDLELLRKESETFQYYESLGKLSIVDELPQEAMSSEQLIMSLRTENEMLKQQQGSDEALQELKKELEEATAKIAEQAAVIEEKEKMIVALDEQLAAMAAEMNEAPEQEKE